MDLSFVPFENKEKNLYFKNIFIIDGQIKFVFNEDFKNGMASSIKTGLNNLSEKTEVFFICLGDMPMVNHNIYNQLIKSKDNKEKLVIWYT